MKSCIIKKHVRGDTNHLSVTADYKLLSIISAHFPNEEDIFHFFEDGEKNPHIKLNKIFYLEYFEKKDGVCL